MATEHLDDSGNVRVDFVWGNMAMQPNYARQDDYVWNPGTQNVGWSGTELFLSDTLRIADYYKTLNNLEYEISTDHVRASIGYSNFPEYIENYAGDGDAELEGVVPNLFRLTRNEAEDKLDATPNMDWDWEWANPNVTGLTSVSDRVVKVYIDSWQNVLKVGDIVYISTSEGSMNAEVTALNSENADEITVTDVNESATWDIDMPVGGTIYSGSNTYQLVIGQDEEPGSASNGTYFYVLGSD